jgi:hypothetical protein
VQRIAIFFMLAASLAPACLKAQDYPRLVENNGRHALIVDGKPFLVLGGQINNSSAWPATINDVWPVLEGMHANTVEAPVYWEQMEPRPGQFDFSMVDMLVDQARQHHFHLIVLWFGTWKNGEMHYVPDWIKSNSARYPRMIDERGEPIQVLSASSQDNLEADRSAFRALTHHLHEIDSTQHTVLMIQVENESGAIGAVRDHSPLAEKQFEGQVPAELTTRLQKPAGTWSQVFGADADETFQAYTQASYINEVAKAGKEEFPVPMYCNVWVQYPKGYTIRGRQNPGLDYPSGGAVQTMISLWKIAAPAIDILAPDLYSSDRSFQKELLATYARPDNPLWVPEAGLGESFAAGFVYELGMGGIGFSPFGTDQTSWTLKPGQLPEAHAETFALLAPLDGVIARLNYEGKLKTAVEEDGNPEKTLRFGRWVAKVGFGFPQRDGEQHAPGTKENLGRAFVAQLGPDQFLVTGIEARVTFSLAPEEKGHMQIMKAEEGSYHGETWQPARIWNGDQTDRGLNFSHQHSVVLIQLGTY